MMTPDVLPEPSQVDPPAILSACHGPCCALRERTIKPRAFNGETSWRSYQNQYNRTADINRWSTETRKKHLWINLSGTALDYVDQLPEERTYTYEDMCAAWTYGLGLSVCQRSSVLNWTIVYADPRRA